MKRWWIPAVIWAAVLAGLWYEFAAAQNPTAPGGQQIVGVPVNRTTVNGSVAITTGGTFQTILSANVPTTQTSTYVSRQSLTIQNNNTTSDNCWVFLGGGSATKATAILLQPAQAYTRFWPYVPGDTIQATCATTSDTLYVDTQ